MAERKGAAVYVDDVWVDAEYPCGVDRDAGESLVYLDQVQVIRAPSGSFEREFARVSWNSEQVRRFLGYFGVRHDGGERFEAALFGEALAREHEGAGAVCDTRGVARGHRATFVYGLERCQFLQGRVVPDRLVGLDVVYLSLFARDFDADYLFGKSSLVGRRGGSLVASERPFVLLFAGDTELPGAFGAEADHVHVLEGVEQAVVHHGVERGHVAHAPPPAGFRQQIWDFRHALHTAGQDHAVVAGTDHGLSERRAPQTRGAHLVECLRCQRERETRVEVGLAGWDLPYSGLHHDTEDGVLQVSVLDTGAVYSVPDRRPTQLWGAQEGQRAAEPAKRRPRRPEDYCAFQCDSSVWKTNDHSLSLPGTKRVFRRSGAARQRVKPERTLEL